MQRGKCVPCRPGSANPDCRAKPVQASVAAAVSKSESEGNTVKNEKEIVSNVPSNNVAAPTDPGNSAASPPDTSAKSNAATSKESSPLGLTNGQSSSSQTTTAQNPPDNSNLSLNQLIFSMLPAGCCEFKLVPQLECSKCDEKYQLTASKKCELIQQTNQPDLPKQ